MTAKPAAYVLWAATVYAYRVTVYDADLQPLEDYTGGNSRYDSAAFVPVAEGESLETMTAYAKITAAEMANKWGVAPIDINEDADETDYLRETYAPRAA